MRINKFQIENLRKLIGKQIKIISGNWKGYQGILKNVIDKRARIELHSKNKIISVDVNAIQDLYGEITNLNNNSNAFNMGIQTPQYNSIKTPTYYPQSPSYNPQAWNPSTRNLFKLIFFLIKFFKSFSKLLVQYFAESELQSFYEQWQLKN